ncbi:WYL domain-containing protein [Caenibius tardaugens]|nr:WYL domain-containing protein [Caenibius tardaugens]AZI34934.1 WYL domain-containing protein [Caenibius tardaugens NBRC 16725]
MQQPPESEATAEQKFFEAIARKRLIHADYNGATMQLAPHQLFMRHGELFVSAFNPAKNWRSEEDWRLGNFKLAGLSNVALTEDPFDPLPTFDGSVPREGDQQLFAVE